MAATSHDFWNSNLGPGIWKALHMAVYPAYGLLVGHVALGSLQFEKHPLYIGGLWVCVIVVSGLHLLAAFRYSSAASVAQSGAWLRVGHVSEIQDSRAKIVQPPKGERIAVFKSGAEIAAVSNVCRHQGAPLGEGRVVDGCITCPWHGYQYRMSDGQSPAPFTEKIATYAARVEANGDVYVRAEPNAPGTAQTPASIPEAYV